MASGRDTNTEAKRRQRARLDPDAGGINAQERTRAERLREFMDRGQLDWATEVAPEAQHVCDLVVSITQFQAARGGILVMNVPNAYTMNALLAKQCNKLYIRAYSLDDIDALLDEAEEDAPDLDDIV